VVNLQINEKIGWQGIIKIKVVDAKTKKIKHQETIYNQITKLALNEMITALLGDTVDLEIKELAIGDDDTATSSNDEALGNEIYRVSDTDSGVSDIGEVTTEFVIKGTEYTAIQATGVIEELGIYAGSAAAVYGAGAGIDTGLLLARVLWSYELIASEDIYIQRIDLLYA
jgi:hypothetical protein